MPESGQIRFDSIPVDETYFTAEGYFIGHPIVTSTGIFAYKNRDGTIRRELRLPEEVFDPAGLESYDAIQRNIRINRLALVANARAGDSARLNLDGDNPEEKEEHR